MAFLNDARFRAVAIQIALVAGIAGTIWWLADNTIRNLAARGIRVGFDYLTSPARFPISESLVAYQPTDSFARAYVVGLVNTVFISVIIVAGASLLGLGVALARRSKHPLTYGLVTVFVETMRNTPLVVQLLFWYALVTTALPAPRAALNPLPGVFLSVRGLIVPALSIEGDAGPFWSAILAAAFLLAVLQIIAWRYRGREGKTLPQLGLLRAGACVLPLAVWFASGLGFSVEMPQLRGFNFAGGLPFTPEFVSLILGLILYSSAFIGEIIRGGIDAVAKGQWEAGRAMGLSEGRILRLIIIPQALRVIIPPMTSQYFNIVKNTTLALVVGYPDISFVVATTINQTGQVIEGVAILVAVFLTLSVAISLGMNTYNRRVALVQR